MPIVSDQRETPVKWTQFLHSEPASSNSKNCVSLSYISQWSWVTRECDEPVLFLCEKGSYPASWGGENYGL